MAGDIVAHLCYVVTLYALFMPINFGGGCDITWGGALCIVISYMMALDVFMKSWVCCHFL